MSGSRTRWPAVAVLVGSLALATGCGRPPALYPVTGKVTLGGKGYPRLLVYFRPASGLVTEYNHAVGETDKDGALGIRSAAGNGLQAGEYRVTFALYLDNRSGKAVGGTDKPDESGLSTRQVIPSPYDDETSQSKTPVTFSVKPGENSFSFDIPPK